MDKLISVLPTVEHMVTAGFAFAGAVLARQNLSAAIIVRLRRLERAVFGRASDEPGPAIPPVK